MRRLLYPLIAVLMLAGASLACLQSSTPPTAYTVGSDLDGYITTLDGILTYGEPRQVVLDGYSSAHNWTFIGSAGDTVVIRVIGINGSDPHTRLFDDNGTLIGENDDSAYGLDSEITATLPTDGAYTIRIDMYTTGEYQVSVQRP